MKNCIKCGHKTNIVLGSDPDMSGIPACHKCKDEVKADLLLVFSDIEEFDIDWFEDKYNLNKKDK